MLLVEGGRSQHREWSFAQQAAAAGDSHRMLHFAAATLAADPSFVPAAILRSEALGEVGRLNEAMEGFESALKLQPRSADIYAKMGNTFRRGAYWSANSLSKKDNGPDGADAVNVRARWWKLALESMRTATLLDPRNAECYAGLADVLSMQARRRDDPRADAPHGGSSKEGIAAAEGEAAAARAHAVQLFSEALIQDRRAGAPGHQGDDRKGAESEAPTHPSHEAARFRSSKRLPWLVAPRAGGGASFLPAASTRMLAFDTCCGWGNQMVMLVAAVEIAQRLNRTLLLPPFTPFKVHRSQGGDGSYPQGRYVSWARFLDLRALNALVPTVALDAPIEESLEGWHALGLSSATASPPRVIHGRPRWGEAEMAALALGSRDVDVLRLRTNLWGWVPSPAFEAAAYASIRFNPALVALADRLIGAALERAGFVGAPDAPPDATAPPRGHERPRLPTFGALHVRRTDKVRSHQYVDYWELLTPEHFAVRARQLGLPAHAPLFVATDEGSRAWFAPLAADFTLIFASDLDSDLLLDELHAYPPEFWNDVLSMLEVLICVRADAFVPSLPSTVSGVIYNARAAAAAAATATVAGSDAESCASGEASEEAPPPFFRKVHPRCCDAATIAEFAYHGDEALGRVCETAQAGSVINPYC